MLIFRCLALALEMTSCDLEVPADFSMSDIALFKEVCLNRFFSTSPDLSDTLTVLLVCKRLARSVRWLTRTGAVFFEPRRIEIDGADVSIVDSLPSVTDLDRWRLDVELLLDKGNVGLLFIKI
jgi:hypothetical protein